MYFINCTQSIPNKPILPTMHILFHHATSFQFKRMVFKERMKYMYQSGSYRHVSPSYISTFNVLHLLTSTCPAISNKPYYILQLHKQSHLRLFPACWIFIESCLQSLSIMNSTKKILSWIVLQTFLPRLY